MKWFGIPAIMVRNRQKVLASFSARFIAFASINKTPLILLILLGTFIPVIQPQGAESSQQPM
jgi:hypothetical protein